MDYSKLVEYLRKQESNRKCFDCGVVGTTYASLNFGTFVCSQCAGILRGLNYKVKPLGISIFTLNEYEILQKNGNEKAKNIWLGLYDPYKHEKPNPKNYNDVKNHLIRKYKEKKFFRESKGIHFINKSIEEDIKDPLELKCKIKNINIGPLWTHKKVEKKDNEKNNPDKGDNLNGNENKNVSKNIDLLGGLLELGDKENNNNNNKKINDVNDLLGGLNFNNDNKVEKLNNMINNLNNNNINKKDENDFGFDFSSFNNNSSNSQNIIHNTNKEEIKDENFGFDFVDEKPDNNNNKDIISNNKSDDKKESGINLLGFEYNNSDNTQDLNNNNANKEENILELDLGNNEQNQNNSDKNLGFNFYSNEIMSKQEEKEGDDINKKKVDENKTNNIIDLGFNFESKNEEKKEKINESQNINSIFEDPNTEKINDMKNNQETKRNENFQNLTNTLENQNQIDKINQGNVDYFLINSK